MRNLRSAAQEASEDIFFGQVVINWARWFIIVAGALLVIWTAGSPADLVIGVIPVVALMAVNFYLHGRHIAERPANLALISLASILDLAVITVVVVFWPTETHRGLASPFFIMFYPMVLAFAFVMPPRMAVVYTVASVAAYAGACILVGVPVVTDDCPGCHRKVTPRSSPRRLAPSRSWSPANHNPGRHAALGRLPTTGGSSEPSPGGPG